MRTKVIANSGMREQLLNIRPVAQEWEWQFKGLCRSADPEMFFLEPGMRMGTKTNREQAAKKVCSACPVIKECRTHALTAPEDYGVWGGLSADERLVILGKELVN